jgi:DNA end-binding protein Ku
MRANWRANWKGYLRLGAVTCPVALYSATSTSDRIVFNTLNRSTGHRVRREFVDSATGETVEKDDQVKGYETEKDQYIVLEPDEIAEAGPKSGKAGDKTIDVSAFIACSEIDEAFFDKPYYLAPTDRIGEETFVVIRDGLRRRDAAALAHAVLFRRLRTLLVRPHGNGLLATTLHFDYEIRSASEAFADIPELQIQPEMLDLAKHIIQTKQGAFDPRQYEDRYEAALADLIKAKLEGREIAAPRKRQPHPAADLMQALRESAGLAPKSERRARVKNASPAAQKRPAKDQPQEKSAKSRPGRRKAS